MCSLSWKLLLLTWLLEKNPLMFIQKLLWGIISTMDVKVILKFYGISSQNYMCVIVRVCTCVSLFICACRGRTMLLGGGATPKKKNPWIDLLIIWIPSPPNKKKRKLYFSPSKKWAISRYSFWLLQLLFGVNAFIKWDDFSIPIRKKILSVWVGYRLCVCVL